MEHAANADGFVESRWRLMNLGGFTIGATLNHTVKSLLLAKIAV